MSSENYEKLLDQFMGLREAGMLTSTSESYLRRHSVGGQEPVIPHIKLAGKIKFRIRDLETWIASQNEE